LIYHEDYLKHKTGLMHPEHEGRLVAVIDHLKKSDLWGKLLHITPSPADTKWILKVHTAEHLKFVREMCERGPNTSGQGDAVLDREGDTHVCRESYAVALLAVGGVLAGIDTVMSGKVKNAFCAVRPPGHHAESSRAMGFCLFNNVAVGARYAQEKHGLKRVAIVDWDVHHGNGTQEIFYEDPSVLYISTHQYPFYPGTGSAGDRGAGKGEGFTLNIPLRAGTDGEEYVKLFKEKVLPAVKDFKPNFLFISAGFDAHKDDPLAGLLLDESAYAEITRMLTTVAKKHCASRIVSVLEGGYDLNALPRCVETHLEVFNAIRMIQDVGRPVWSTYPGSNMSGSDN
jgi:acetoin utilization deacetylase AcuC-like enzyme